MKQFEEKKFNLGGLKGISEKTIEEHLKLYAGYVKNTNSILERIPDYLQWAEKDPFVTYFTGELQRRFGFEYDGMRNHEIYFDSLSDGSAKIVKDGPLQKAIIEEWDSFDRWLTQFKTLAMTRGVGWAILYFDKKEMRLLNAYVGDHELGQLVGCTPILALDMWEHAFVADYQPSGKKDYVNDFFLNLNWDKIERNLDMASK